MGAEFHRIAIVNRGEPAMRLIHAVRELNRVEARSEPLRAIAFFTEPDRCAMFVREADESCCLGAATFADENGGHRKNTYLHYGRLEEALVATRAEAAWVGWGFVAEHARFADLCERLGIVFIGPPGSVMRKLGDKIGSKRIAEEAGVPMAPWSGGAVETVEQAGLAAKRIGYPLVIKATAGGGGRGIRKVFAAGEIEDAFERARSEALNSFGDATVFLERLITGARHIEVQIIADGHGSTWALGVRDCTIQRRNQKILEEAPSPVLSAKQDASLREAAVSLSRAAKYCGAGTVEFLYEPRGQVFSFMEVNARLQVEHPVTEAVTGADIVKLQIHVARGGRLEGTPPPSTGHAIEARLNAEDPNRGFAPSSGEIRVLRLPGGPGIRVDTGMCQGDSIPAEFDSMITKIIAHGRDRGEAIARLQRALDDCTVILSEGTTNKALLSELLRCPQVYACEGDNAWLDEWIRTGVQGRRRHAEVGLICAAVQAYDAEFAVEQSQFHSWALRGRPRVSAEIGRAVELSYGNIIYRFDVLRLGPSRYRVTVDGARVDVHTQTLSAHERFLSCGEQRFRVLSAEQGAAYLIEVEGIPHRIAREDAGLVRAPSPAVVLAINVKPGDRVEAGTRLAVLEAMKMELPVIAPFAGKVREVFVGTNVQVDAGAQLMLLEAEELRQDTATGESVDFSGLVSRAAEATAETESVLADLRSLMLGFDVQRGDVPRLLDAYVTLRRSLDPADAALWAGEEELLAIYTDMCSLFRRQPASDDPEAVETTHAEEYFFTYLRSMDRRGERLPPQFLEKLERALRHYGVDSLDPGPRLAESVVRIFKAHQRVEEQSAVVSSILERRLERVDSVHGLADDEFRACIDRIINVSHGRDDALGDLARELRYRLFDQPLFDSVRRRVYAEMDEHLERLLREPAEPERAERMEALVSCPQPLVGVLAPRFRTASPTLRNLMLEVLTRRYYRVREIETVRCEQLSGRSCAVAEYVFEGKRIHAIATHTTLDDLGHAIQAKRKIIEATPPEDDVVIDFYVWEPEAPLDAERLAEKLGAVVNEHAPTRRIRRLVVVVAGATGGGIGSVVHFTFRPTNGGYEEERVFRGLHPMMSKRLHLWRLSNFEIRRLPSVEDVYLFHGVARSNPKDERLFAIAEVRDLTPVRDAGGRIAQLPYLERMLMEALAAMRRFQLGRPARQRLGWNRVLLYVWPVMNLRQDELSELIRRLAPATEGLGIEQLIVRARIPDAATGDLRDTVVRISNPRGTGPMVVMGPPPTKPLEPLSDYDQKVLRMHQRGLMYPYEIVRMLTPEDDTSRRGFPRGEFVEHDLDEAGRLVPVDRPHGKNVANIITGVIRNFTTAYSEGMTRVILLGDPSKAMGALAEPECRRINAALDLAEQMRVPLEWFALSAGAKISMESGTENMDWIAAVLRRLIEFTQAGGEVNVIVNGINVGAQPYWNAEATMLMHTRGILIMTPLGAMVLTGKQALDYSGSVSAEDNFGIGGYDRIMGPNGQAQYWARDIVEASQLLLRHYEHTYVAPGETFPRQVPTSDPADRDVRGFPHGPADGSTFDYVGEIFSADKNVGRKQPFEIRIVMRAVIDQDHEPLERWTAMRDAEIAVVWDTHLGGVPVAMLGIQSHSIPRRGFLPADGPDQWTAGTLFPKSSKKIARAVNSASGNRPLVILANLSGFDGSPESMREVQLEFGAEIGRAVVNFKGPIVFCVVSRYHGGAYVVFSSKLNEHIEVAALEGSYASVIGGAPAAAVVFAGEVRTRTSNDPRVRSLEERLRAAEGHERLRLRAELDAVSKDVYAEKLGEVADEFDKVHSVQRALEMGSLHRIVSARQLRPYLIDAVGRGMRAWLESQREEKESSK